MDSGTLSVAVLISGTGSNLKAIIDAQKSGRLNVDIDRVISNKADAGGLVFAREAGIPCSVIPSTGAPSREAHDAAISRCLDETGPDLVVLAGYMRILGGEMVARFRGKIINLHPSLLPKYPGLDTYRKALDAGDAEQRPASIEDSEHAHDSENFDDFLFVPVLGKAGEKFVSDPIRYGSCSHGKFDGNAFGLIK